MNENHELVLQRGEKIENVLEKSEQLKDHAVTIKRSAQKARAKKFFEKYAMYLLAAGLFVALLMFLYFLLRT